MVDDQDYILEIGGQTVRNGQEAEVGASSGRPFISVQFDCCQVYSRVYKNREGTAYVGWCPKCARKVTVKVGAGGVNCRFFRAS